MVNCRQGGYKTLLIVDPLKTTPGLSETSFGEREYATTPCVVDPNQALVPNRIFVQVVSLGAHTWGETGSSFLIPGDVTGAYAHILRKRPLSPSAI